jgi:ribosomal protein L33
MAKGKSQFATWYCTSCGSANYISAYNKKNNDKIKKELRKFCKPERKTIVHKRKDTKKGSNK